MSNKKMSDSETKLTTGQQVTRLRKISLKPPIPGDPMPEDVVRECREVFSMFDKDKDGVITYDELICVMRLLDNNPTDTDLRNIMHDLDNDGNGRVEFDEFLRVVENHWKEPVDEETELKNAFKVFDRNGDGYVVASEIQYVMHHLGHDLTFDDVARIMQRGDMNSDGKLDYNEFVRVMLQTWRIDDEKKEEEDGEHTSVVDEEVFLDDKEKETERDLSRDNNESKPT